MEMKNEWVKDPKIFNVNRLRATKKTKQFQLFIKWELEVSLCNRI